MFEPLPEPYDEPEDACPEGLHDVVDPLEELAACQALDAVLGAEESSGVADDPDAGAVLARVAAGQRRINLDQAEQLALAARWADLHAALDFPKRRPGGERLVRRAGEGTPRFAEFAPAELGAVLGVSSGSAGFLICDALDLRHRLPLLWAKAQTGDVKIWVVRKVASRTRQLSQDAAASVDRKVAPIAATVPFSRLERIMDAAILRADPPQAASDAAAAAAGQGVWVGRETDHGHGTIVGKAPMPDIRAVDISLDTLARAMTVLGDTDSHDIRRAKALGILADPAAALELTRLADEALADGTAEAGGTHDGTDPRRGCDLGPCTLYVHLSHSELVDALTDSGVARVQDVGPVLLAQVRDWLQHRRVKLKPVIDIAGIPAVDCYETPDRTAEALRLRTPADCSPYSGNVSLKGDNEHTIPYRPMNRGGPPGQTAVDAMGRMSRRPHRIKTHGRWRVSQPRSDTWIWISPHGYRFLVDPMGTTPLGRL